MNSLFKLCDYGRRAVIALMIVSSLGLAVAAQRIEPAQQGRMYGDPGFRGEPINLNVVNADIRDILNYITEQYGVNFVIDKSVKASPVTVNVSDVPWNVALDSILRSQELGVQVNGSILRVADSKSLAVEGEIYRQQMDNQLDSAALYTEFIRLNYARAKGSIVRGTATSGTAAGNSSMGSFTPISGGSSFSSASASSSAGGASGEGLLPIIQRRLSRRGSVEVDSRSNSLIITDVRQNIDAIRQLVAILDQPEPQVEIESRIVVATRSFSRDLGTELSGSVTGPGGKGATFGTDLTAANPINTVIGLTTGIFGTAKINLAISAGENKGQAKTIATPRVTTLNNRKAKIESKTQIPIQTIQPNSQGAAPVVTTTYIDVPLKLEITPQVTDVGTVVLDVVAENSSVPQIVPGGQAPAINSQAMETQVTVPDGGTTVVGGVLFDNEQDNQNRTPGLSKIPLLGNLFRRKNTIRDSTEILFFITPRIQRPDWVQPMAGQSGVKSSAMIVQPVPLGNPASNSSDVPADLMVKPSAAPMVPVVQTQPVANPQKP
jgi:type IV pilus assembly protein PilQ